MLDLIVTKYLNYLNVRRGYNMKEEFIDTEETEGTKRRYDTTYKHIALPPKLYEELTKLKTKEPSALDSYPKVVSHLMEIKKVYKPYTEEKTLCKKCGDIVNVPESQKWDIRNLVHRHFGKDCDGHFTTKFVPKEYVEIDCPNCKTKENETKNHNLMSFDGIKFKCNECKKEFELKEKVVNEF